MKQSVLVVALLALALTACGEKAAEVANTTVDVAASAPAVVDVASAVAGESAVSEVATTASGVADTADSAADAMKK